MVNNTDSPKFGIENTMDMGAGSPDLIKGLLDTGAATTDAEDISSIEDDDDKNTEKPGENVDDKTAKNPDSLADFLLADGAEEEEEEEEEDAKPNAVDAAVDKKTEEEEEEEEQEGEESAVNFGALANDLAELGVFSKNEGEESIEIDSSEDFVTRFTEEKTKAANEMVSNFIGQFGQDYQDAFDAIYVKGLDPKTFFSAQAKLESFTDMDLSVERNQEAIVRQTLLNQGFEPDDAESEIDRLKNYGDLEDVSKKHHKVLIKKESASLKQQTLEAQQKQQNKLAQKQEYAQNVNDVLTEKAKNKEFDGIPLNPKIARELQDFLLVDKWKTESGETLTDFDKTILDLKRPENHANKVKIGLLLKLLENDPTLSTIQKSGVSKKSSALFKEVARQKTKTTHVGGKRKPASSWFK